MKVLVFTTLFPNNVSPNNAVFVKERLKNVAKLCDVKVVAPVPFFPPLKICKKWYQFFQVEEKEIIKGLKVYHPRYFITPKIGMVFYGFFIYLSVLAKVKLIQKKFDFDLIDAHYVYPDGFAAVLLGNFFKKPVVISARGTDINLYPKFPLIRKQIIYSLENAAKIISVCQALKDKMVEMGISQEKIEVIPNGIDTEKFYPIEVLKARKDLNLPFDKKVILSVGHLIERKGFHCLIDAISMTVKLRPDILLVIIGEGEFRKKLEFQIRDLSLEKYVKLFGAIPHSELYKWYSAADLFCLASSREGWPNVLFESLACGIPIVATRVFGTPEVITSEEYGILIDGQSSKKFSQGILKALDRNWNKNKLVAYARQNTWDKVAQRVHSLHLSVIKKGAAYLNILYHHRTQADGGEGIHISKMVEAFRNFGYSVKIVALVKDKGRRNKFWEFIAKFSPGIFYEFMEIGYNLIGYLKLSKTIQTFHPHFIYERYSLHNFAGIIAAKRYNIPLFLEVNSPLAYEKEKYEKLIFKKIAKATEKWIFSRTDRILVVSNVLKKHLLKIGISKNKISIIPNGANLASFKEYDNGQIIRQLYGVNRKIIIGFCGFFRKWHNIQLLLEIIEEARICNSNLGLHLMLVGDGPAQESLEYYVRNHGFQDSVIFTGRVNSKEIPKYIAAFDIAILPSITPYASPIKIFEYMVMAKTIIAPRLENIEEILTDNRNALLFTPNDKRELKKVIFKLAADSEFRKRLGENAKQTILERGYSWENNAEKIVEIYNGIAGS